MAQAEPLGRVADRWLPVAVETLHHQQQLVLSRPQTGLAGRFLGELEEGAQRATEAGQGLEVVARKRGCRHGVRTPARMGSGWPGRLPRRAGAAWRGRL